MSIATRLTDRERSILNYLSYHTEEETIKLYDISVARLNHIICKAKRIKMWQMREQNRRKNLQDFL